MDESIHKTTLSPSGLTKDTQGNDHLRPYLVEYEYLRREIEWLSKDSSRYQNLAITLVGAVSAAAAWVFENANLYFVPTLLAIPFLFCLLAFLFFRQYEEIYVVAAYLKEYVRPKLRLLTKDNDLWSWEEFKAERMVEMNKGGFFKRLSTIKMIVILRMLLFIIPSMLSMFITVFYVVSQGIEQLIGDYGVILCALFVFGFLFNTVIIAILLTYLLTQGDLGRILRL